MKGVLYIAYYDVSSCYLGVIILLTQSQVTKADCTKADKAVFLINATYNEQK